MQQALRKWQVSVLQSANGEDYSQGRKPAGE